MRLFAVIVSRETCPAHKNQCFISQIVGPSTLNALNLSIHQASIRAVGGLVWLVFLLGGLFKGTGFRLEPDQATIGI